MTQKPRNPVGAKSASTIKRTEKQGLFAGVDVGKVYLDLHVGDFAHRYAAHDVQGVLAACLLRGVYCIVVESTGGYERPLISACHAVGLLCARVPPNRVRAFAKAEGLQAKNDQLDAALLARFGERMLPRTTPSQDKARETLRALCDRRWHLVYDQTRERNREENAVPLVQRSILKMRAIMEAQVHLLDAEIVVILKRHFPAHAKVYLSVSGVGPVCAASMIAYMPELGYATNEEVSSLAGLAPFVQQSGQWKGKRRIAGGRFPARRALYMSAVSASHHNPVLSVFYARLTSKGKATKVAYTAVARRLLCHLNTLAGGLVEKNVG